MIGRVSVERTKYWTCNVGIGAVGKCAERNGWLVATAGRVSKSSVILVKQCVRISEHKLDVIIGGRVGG
jgi:hypothetical protein